MLHSKHVTVPKNTLETQPVRHQFLINRGTIIRAYIHFPWGCAGLVKLRVLHEGHPFLPVEADAHIRGDDFTFDLPIMYEIRNMPELITIEAWNEDDTYDHTVDVLLLTVPKTRIELLDAIQTIIDVQRNLIALREQS